MRDRVTAASPVLADLAHGRYRDYLPLYREAPERLEPLARADLALYVGELDAAREALDEAPACRLRRVIEAEIDIDEGCDLAVVDARLVQIGTIRAALNRARIAYKLAAWDECLLYAVKAGEKARKADNLFLRGRAAHIEGIALAEKGAFALAESAYNEALLALRSSEDFRFRACAEMSLTWIVCERDEGEALDLLLSASETMHDVGHDREIAVATGALIHFAHQVGRYAVAESHARAAMNRALKAGDAIAEFYARRDLACASLALGHVEQAAAVVEALTFSAMAIGPFKQLEADALAARVRARAYEAGDEAFPTLVKRADALEGFWCGEIARLWWYDALRSIDAVEAFARREDLYEPFVDSKNSWVRAEARAIVAAPRVVLYDGTKLTIEPTAESGAFAKMQQATDATKVTMLAGALRRTGNKQLAAAKLLGQSQSTTSDMMRMRSMPSAPAHRPSKERAGES